MTGPTLDQRDACTWVAVELTRQGELRIEDGSLSKTIRQDLRVGPDFAIFIPALTYYKSGKPVTIFLLEGYVFLASGLDETIYFSLERKPYVERVMAPPTGPNKLRTLHTLPNEEIEKLRGKLREMTADDIQVKDWVKVVEGPYTTLEGRVMALDKVNASIKIELKSLKTITPIPRIFLEVILEEK